MIVIREGELFYVTSWRYNCARVITQLAKLVELKGGKVKYGYSANLVNRSITTAIRVKKEKLEKGGNISGLEADIAALKAIPNEPIKVTHTSYISFVIDGMYYYYQADDNPFMEFLYIKTPVVNGEYSRDACLEEASNAWADGALLGANCPIETIEATARELLDSLLKANMSVKWIEKKRKREPNIGGKGYHMKTIYAKERMGKIDF